MEYNRISGWFSACRSSQLAFSPLSVNVLGKQIVLFRDSKGSVSALLDKCSHRGAPLSKGFVHNDSLVCCYHGWSFNGCGQCVNVPELPANNEIPKRSHVPSFRVSEKNGYLWVNMSESDESSSVFDMLDLVSADTTALVTTYNTAVVQGNWFNMMENVLDGVHLNYIHKGSLNSKKNPLYSWSRKYRKKKIDRKNYLLKDTPDGFVATLDSEKKKFSFHVILPSTVYINMNFGDKCIVVGVHVVPLSDSICRVEHSFTRSFFKNRMLNPVFKYMARKYLMEDARIVELLQSNYNIYGRNSETSTTNDRLAIYLRKKLLDTYHKSADILHENARPAVKKEV